MWLLKVWDGQRERRIITNAVNLNLIERTLSDFGFQPKSFLVSDYRDPVTATKFVIDPETLEILALPEDFARRIREHGYCEATPLKSLQEVLSG